VDIIATGMMNCNLHTLALDSFKLTMFRNINYLVMVVESHGSRIRHQNKSCDDVSFFLDFETTILTLP
jgi:hypothetical protein